MKASPGGPLGPDSPHLAAHLFSRQQLTLARELRGLSKADLATRIGKTPSAVSQFEAGAIRPDSSTVARLAFALGVPTSFFAARPRVQPLTLEGCHFRSLRSAPQRVRRQMLASGTLFAQLLELVEEYVEFPQPGVPDGAPPSASNDGESETIEARADDVRRRWGLGRGPIPNLVQLLEGKGIVVSWIPEACESVDAFSTWCGSRPLVFLSKRAPSRTRFDASHELGHLVMHADVEPGSRLHEKQAHRFAGAFLVPREPFLAECPRRLDWDHLYELKRRWGISVQALVRRAYDLGVFSEPTYRRAFMQLSSRGERVNERDETEYERTSLLAKALRSTGDLSVTELTRHLGVSVPAILEILRQQDVGDVG